MRDITPDRREAGTSGAAIIAVLVVLAGLLAGAVADSDAFQRWRTKVRVQMCRDARGTPIVDGARYVRCDPPRWLDLSR